MPVVIRILEQSGVLDYPNARSGHTRAVPRGGGVVLVMCFLLASGVFAGLPLFGVIAVVPMTCLGGADDLHSLRPIVKLAVQVVIAAAATAALFWHHPYGGRPWILIMCAAGVTLVFLVNAVNFMDGIDGISGLFGALAGGWFLWLGVTTGAPRLAVGGAALVGASLAFLFFNLPHGRVFLGDVGSYGLGAIFFVLIVLAMQAGTPWWLASAPMHLYACDALATVLRRAWSRRPLLTAQRDHVYQRVLDVSGWRHQTVAATAALASAAEVALLACSDDVGAQAGRVTLRCLAVAVLVAYLGLPEMVLKLRASSVRA
jgi:UDP-N-acetylmuramyl pentapeptide phosphotransferase/UDP-N-acetylglucosamine-1-phosphate transferase